MAANDVEIAWDAARAANLANWDDRVAVHLEGYDIDSFEDPTHLSQVIRHDLDALSAVLPDGVAGLDVAHLQCHIGTDTISLARAGAQVTGLDFSGEALEAAAQLAGRFGAEVRWVQSDVLDAAAAIGGDVDLVYTSIGTICWLDDLDRWAAQIAALLCPGGTFFIRDGHPMLYSLDEAADQPVLRYRYFSGGFAQSWESAGTYAGEGTVQNTRTYQWAHPISEIVNALIGAGLTILRLDEGDVLPWPFSPRMIETPEGWVWPEPERESIPRTFTVIARK
ncbi:MAG: class I SAM-dependent methyltransferase [Microbacterium sp.]